MRFKRGRIIRARGCGVEGNHLAAFTAGPLRGCRAARKHLVLSGSDFVWRHGNLPRHAINRFHFEHNLAHTHSEQSTGARLVDHKVISEIKLSTQRHLLLDDSGAHVVGCHVRWDLNIATRA